jgi:outer membrane usher protein
MSARAHWWHHKSIYPLAWWACGWLPTSALTQTAPSNGLPTEPIVVSLVLNGTALTDAQLLHRELGPGSTRIWVPEKEAFAWRINLSSRAHRQIENLAHVSLCELRDRCFYDEASALLTVTLDNADILALRFTPPQTSTEAVANTQSTGGYLNYDVQAWHNGQPGVSALLEGKVYSPYGYGTVRTGGILVSGQGSRALTQATWQIDHPKQGYSVQIGSIYVPDTPLGAGLPLTGLRIGSNPSLQPTVSQMLRPRMDGVAERSLRADVFMDGLFRQTAQVPYGPYSIELQPQFPGRGDMDLVSTDISGLQVRRSLPYYHAPQMLMPGAIEWSADVGVLARSNNQTATQQPGLASGMVRLGINRALTGQAQAVLAQGATRLTLAGETSAAERGLSSASVVWQRSETRPQGQLWLGVGHEYTAHDIALNIKTEQSLNGCQNDVTTQALTDRIWRPCRAVSTGVGFTIDSRWSMGAAIEARQENSLRRTHLASITARLQTGPRSQVGVSLQRVTINTYTSTGIFATWSLPLGNNYDAQLSLQQRVGEKPSLQWSAQSTPPPDAQTETQRIQTYGSVGQYNAIGARWTQRTAQADWRADAQVDPRGPSTSVGVSGAIGLAEGHVFRSRRINDAFILVDAGLPDLPVLLDNREVARTNADGWAIVTEGRAYQANTVGVDTSALPIEYAMPRDQQNVVPTSAAGVLARFDISDGGVAIPVLDSAGQAIPAGAQVFISTQGLPTAITSRSEVFFERSDRAAEVTIEWSGKRCRFNYQPQGEPTGGYRCAQ